MYLAEGDMDMRSADDDAKDIKIFSFEDLHNIDLADHKQILHDIFDYLN